MIQNKNLAPDAKRRTLTFARDKSAADSSAPAINTYTQRYKITGITLQILEQTGTANGVVHFAPYVDSSGTPLPDAANPVVTITDPYTGSGYPRAVGNYFFGPGGLSIPGVTFPIVLPADKAYGFIGPQASGNGEYIIAVDVEPMDDNPTSIQSRG